MFFDSIGELLEKIIGFMQGSGIVFFAFLSIVGVLLMLVAGKNLIARRLGFFMALMFAIGIFVFTYVPILYYFKINSMVIGEVKDADSIFSGASSSIGYLFGSLLILGTPIIATMIFIGLTLRGFGSVNPQKKRTGLAICIFSPLILLIIYTVPTVLRFL